ncbi:MAG: recombinase family protein [Thermotaleaceae bacterium]
MSVAGIYSRKSLFTGKGESIKNQIESCQQYANSKNWETCIYYDEGFSGQNKNRPGFQKLLKDIDQGNIQHVIFYKLDRISRRMLDILEFIENTNSKGIDFISITENFDTTSPLGRAMVHIAATFAQLEREMLQQRVKDNMLQLAKTGRWLGGVTPTGFCSKMIRYNNMQGKEKTMHVLEEIPEEIQIIKTIYNEYLRHQSLSQVEKSLLQMGILTKNGVNFQKQTIKNILSNPVYVKADPHVYSYFNDLNVDIANSVEDFDGIHGLLSYNKNKNQGEKGNKLRSPENWIIAVSKHQGLINGEQWCYVQHLLSKNNKKGSIWKKSENALLSGFLRCKHCNSPMIIKYGQLNKKTKKRFYYYVCQRKDFSKGIQCSNKNIRGDLLDNAILTAILKMAPEPKEIYAKLNYIEDSLLVGPKSQFGLEKDSKKKIESNEKKIEQLISKLEKNLPSTTTKRIGQRISELDKENALLKSSIDTQLTIPLVQSLNLEIVRSKISNLPFLIENIDDIQMKRTILAKFVYRVLWQEGIAEIIFTPLIQNSKIDVFDVAVK